jgi:hypothetical protein
MLQQSLERKGQQKWWNCHCSLLDDSSQRFCLYSARISCASITRLAVVRILVLNGDRLVAHASFSGTSGNSSYIDYINGNQEN